jgi:hypothetical protein
MPSVPAAVLSGTAAVLAVDLAYPERQFTVCVEDVA